MAQNLKGKLAELAKHGCTGSHLTKEARVNTVKGFADHLKVAFTDTLRDPAQIRTHHIEHYAQALQGKVSGRTLANRLSHIRAVMAAIGKGAMLEQPRLGNAALGAKGSRVGTKTAMEDSDYAKFHNALSEKSPAAAQVMELQRALGLRMNEAVRGANVKTLLQWQQQLESGYAKVALGTKGGRPRETLVSGHERAIAAVNAALKTAKANGGNVLPASNGKQAYDLLRHAYTRIGMVGAQSSHSLRYAWSQEQMQHYRDVGMAEQQARSELSQDLGQGDGRGRYVAMVYLR
jgi:Integrase/Phage integrase, N-terminal